MGCTMENVGGKQYAVCSVDSDGTYAKDEAWESAREATTDSGFTIQVEPVSVFIGVEETPKSGGGAGTRYGVRLGLYNNNTGKDFVGLEVGVVNNQDEPTKGLQLGVINNTNEDISGVQAGFFNHSSKDVNGVQISPLFNKSDGVVRGLETAPINLNDGGIVGAQIGAFNRGDSVHGFQGAITFNVCTGKMSGLQLGMMNNLPIMFFFGIGIDSECPEVSGDYY